MRVAGLSQGEAVVRRHTGTGDERGGKTGKLRRGIRGHRESQILGAALSGGANGRASPHGDRHVDYDLSPISPAGSVACSAYRCADPELSMCKIELPGQDIRSALCRA